MTPFEMAVLQRQRDFADRFFKEPVSVTNGTGNCRWNAADISTEGLKKTLAEVKAKLAELKPRVDAMVMTVGDWDLVKKHFAEFKEPLLWGRFIGGVQLYTEPTIEECFARAKELLEQGKRVALVIGSKVYYDDDILALSAPIDILLQKYLDREVLELGDFLTQEKAPE